MKHTSRQSDRLNLTSIGLLPQTTFYRLRKLRLWFAWPFFLALCVYAKSSPQGFMVGIPIVILGEGIRIWSHGYLRKTRRLAIEGPYSYVRNPLYVGNLLIGFGFCVIIWHPVIAATFLLGFSFLYWVTIKGEEERLLCRFEKDYEAYCKNVRRFIPRLTPYRSKATSVVFAPHRVWGHGELITILAIIDLLILTYVRQELYQRGQVLGLEMITYSLTGLVLAMVLIYALTTRQAKGKRKKKA